MGSGAKPKGKANGGTNLRCADRTSAIVLSAEAPSRKGEAVTRAEFGANCRVIGRIKIRIGEALIYFNGANHLKERQHYLSLLL